MAIVKTLLIGLVALVAVLVVVGFFLPNTAHVERSIVIDAPQSTVFALVSGFPRFNEWSPWAAKDPETKYAYEGPTHGVGAKMSWESEHRDVGVGSQEVVAAEAYSRVETALDFGPQGTADAFFDLSQEGSGTKVVWGFDTEFGMNLVGRYFGLMFDGMLGPDYEKGLASLKAFAESLPRADWSDLEIGTTDVEPVTIAYVTGSSSQDSAEIGPALAAAYGQVIGFIGQHSLTPAGQPLTINTSWDENGFVFDAGLPLAAAPEGEVPEDSAVKIGETYRGKVIKAVHKGSYESLEATYDKVEAYAAVHGLEPTDRPWDQWISDPASTPEDELITHVFFPVKVPAL